MNVAQVQRYVRRFADAPLPRNVNRRVVLTASVVVLFFFYLFLYTRVPPKATPAQVCVADQFVKEFGHEIDPLAASDHVSFIGNGYIGMDVSGNSDLLLRTNSTGPFTFLTGFKPLVQLKLPFGENKALHYVTDTTNGMSKTVRCSHVDEKCICLYEFVYAHRSRPNVLIQDIKLSNPSTDALNIEFSRSISPDWHEETGLAAPVYYKVVYQNNQQVGVAVACSLLPREVVVHPKREESYRFLCVLEHAPFTGDLDTTKRQAVANVLTRFTDVNALHYNRVDIEHKEAWAELNKANFNISESKAPNALNTKQISLTKHAILSSVRAPLVERGADANVIVESKKLALRSELCYQGHSTLLTPSKLWQEWNTLADVFNTVDIWLLTLKHRGCMHLVESGAHGISQAFLLSLTAGTFTHHHMEFTLDPTDDLHRELVVSGLEFSPNVHISLDFVLDSEYRPLVRISSHSAAVPLFACSAGCTTGPFALTKVPQEITLKVTKPPSPILFISADKEKLSNLRHTLHVSEVVDAPKHLPAAIQRHTVGDDTGLPTIFWIIFGTIVAGFHLFLAKLIYSEWKNASDMPYAKFSKKMLLRR
uniref:Transmembrane protein n=1 Tax=Panagrellus redivivus TaxID=6233 RepID=A0A7E4ZSV8_PANRE